MDWCWCLVVSCVLCLVSSAFCPRKQTRPSHGPSACTRWGDIAAHGKNNNGISTCSMKMRAASGKVNFASESVGDSLHVDLLSSLKPPPCSVQQLGATCPQATAIGLEKLKWFSFWGSCCPKGDVRLRRRSVPSHCSLEEAVFTSQRRASTHSALWRTVAGRSVSTAP